MPKDNEELRKLISENPDLPLVFSVANDERCFEYGYQIYECSKCYISEVYFPDDLDYCYEDIDELCEEYMSRYDDIEEYINLSDEEFENRIKDYINKNVRHYKAIVISVF